jgi:hypothetical protein
VTALERPLAQHPRASIGPGLRLLMYMLKGLRIGRLDASSSARSRVRTACCTSAAASWSATC